jgi:hypothetical protein
MGVETSGSSPGFLLETMTPAERKACAKKAADAAIAARKAKGKHSTG